jgi:hypothetical protein
VQLVFLTARTLVAANQETMKRRPRRNRIPVFKAKVAQAIELLPQLAEQLDVHPDQITTWRAQLEDGRPMFSVPAVAKLQSRPWT